MERYAFLIQSLIFVIVVCLILPLTLVSKEEYGRASPSRFHTPACRNLTITEGLQCSSREEKGAGEQGWGACYSGWELGITVFEE